MTPLEFLSFRERLEAASGFQSDQFRQIEFLLGVKSEQAIRRFPDGVARAHRPGATLPGDDAVGRASSAISSREGYESRGAHRDPPPSHDVTDVQQMLVTSTGDPKNAELCERLVDLDEGIQEWRYRHVKMVERTIGARAGTGGSSGAAYLRETVGRPIFPDLWDDSFATMTIDGGGSCGALLVVPRHGARAPHRSFASGMARRVVRGAAARVARRRGARRSEVGARGGAGCARASGLPSPPE